MLPKQGFLRLPSERLNFLELSREGPKVLYVRLDIGRIELGLDNHGGLGEREQASKGTLRLGEVGPQGRGVNMEAQVHGLLCPAHILACGLDRIGRCG